MSDCIYYNFASKLKNNIYLRIILLTMKKALLITSLLISSITIGQENLNPDFNKWSIEVGGGLHKPARPMASGYYTNSPSFGQFSLGARYMFNNRFGLKLDLGYNMFQEGDNSRPFKS